MIQRGIDVKLNVKPILVTLHHDYVFEGPCRWGAGDQLTKPYDDMVNAENVKASKAAINTYLGEKVNLMSPVHIDRNEEFLITPQMLDEMAAENNDVDVYLIADLSRLTDLIIPFAQRVRKPIVLAPRIGPMKTILCAALRARGIDEVYSYRTWEETVEFMDVLRVKKVLATARVLCVSRFGTTRSVSGMDNFVDLEHVTDKLGTQFCFANIHEFLDQTHIRESGNNPTMPGRAALNPTEEDVKAMDAFTDELIAGATECTMTREDVFSSVRAHFTIKKMLDYYQCNAFSIPCPDACATRRLNQERFTFCMNHSMLNEMGIPSSCEYDIPAALSMMILSNFSHTAPYMGNTTHNPVTYRDKTMFLAACFNQSGKCSNSYMDAIQNDPENIILTWHSVPNRRLKGFDAEPTPYALHPFTTSGFGVTLRHDFNQDTGTTVTMARLDPSCNKLFVTRGEIVAGRGFDDYSCSLGVFIKVADGADFYEKQLNFGNHVPLVYADCFDKVCQLGKLLGLEVITA
jgi:L-fucose isomerase-like protein